MKITPKQHIYSPLNNIFFGRGGLNSRLIFKALDLGDTSDWLYGGDYSKYLAYTQEYNPTQGFDNAGYTIFAHNKNRGTTVADLNAKIQARTQRSDYANLQTFTDEWRGRYWDEEHGAERRKKDLISAANTFIASNPNGTLEQFLKWYNDLIGTMYDYRYNHTGNWWNDNATDFNQASKAIYGGLNSDEGLGYNTAYEKYYGDTTASRPLDITTEYITNLDFSDADESVQNLLKGVVKTKSGIIGVNQTADTTQPETPAATTSDEGTPPSATGNTRATGGGSGNKGELGDSTLEVGGENEKHRNYGAFWGKMYKAGLSALPTLMDVGKLWNTIRNNNKVAEEYLKVLHPQLRLTYERYSPVTGNFSARLYYNQQAADVRRMAARNATADASTNLAAQLEANRLANLYEEKGFLTDDQQIQKTAQEALARLEDNAKRRSEIANENMKNIQDVNYQRAAIKADRRKLNTETLNNFIDSLQLRRENAATKKEKQHENLQNLYITNEEKRLLAELDNQWEEYVKKYNSTKTKEEDKISIYSSSAKLHHPWYCAQQAKIREYIQGLVWAAYNNKLNVKSPNSPSSVTWDKWDSYITSEKLGGKLQLMQRGGSFPGFVTATFNVPKYSAPKEEAIRTKAPNKDEITIKDVVDLVKNANLLPNEESAILAELKADIALASLTGMGISDIASKYVQIMDLVNNAKYNKEEYSSAKKTVEANSALDDIAMLPNGNILVLPTEGENKGQIIAITAQQYAQLKNTGLFNTITNSNLLYLRAKDNNYINNNNIFQILQNGVGLSKVYLTIKDNINAVADLRTSQHYYTKGSAEEKALQGLAELAKLKDSLTPEEYQLLALNYQQSIAQLLQLEGNLAEGPAGSYLITNTVKGVLDPDKVKAALTYLWDILPYNQRNRLIAETLSGTEDEAKLLIMRYMIAGVPSSSSETYLPVDPLGRRGGSGGSGSGADSGYDLHMNRAVQAVLEIGTLEEFWFNAGDTKTVIALGKRIANPTGANTTLNTYLSSEMGGIIKSNGISINGVPLNGVDSRWVLFKGTDSYLIAFPSEHKNGEIIPQITEETRAKVKLAEEEIKNAGINICNEESRKENYLKINEIYRKYGLDDAYDKNGKLMQGWDYFLVSNVFVDNTHLSKVTKSELDHNPLFKEVKDPKYREHIAKSADAINNSDFKNNLFPWNNSKIYEGLVWMAVDMNLVSAGLPNNNTSMNASTATQLLAALDANNIEQRAARVSDDGLSNLQAGDRQ